MMGLSTSFPQAVFDFRHTEEVRRSSGQCCSSSSDVANQRGVFISGAVRRRRVILRFISPTRRLFFFRHCGLIFWRRCHFRRRCHVRHRSHTRRRSHVRRHCHVRRRLILLSPSQSLCAEVR